MYIFLTFFLTKRFFFLLIWNIRIRFSWLKYRLLVSKKNDKFSLWCVPSSESFDVRYNGARHSADPRRIRHPSQRGQTVQPNEALFLGLKPVENMWVNNNIVTLRVWVGSCDKKWWRCFTRMPNSINRYSADSANSSIVNVILCHVPTTFNTFNQTRHPIETKTYETLFLKLKYAKLCCNTSGLTGSHANK